MLRLKTTAAHKQEKNSALTVSENRTSENNHKQQLKPQILVTKRESTTQLLQSKRLHELKQEQ